MNASAYASTIESMPDIPGWQCQALVFDAASGTTVARWLAQSGHVYLAVRGSASVRDVQESLKVFLGHEPASRMAFLERYIEETCQQELSEGRLAVGGHSLGGLVALSSAARWNLPALVQNAPGWMTNPPPPERLRKVLEIRTGRDVIGDWGHPIPRQVVLQSPETPWWHLPSLHGVLRQNLTIEAHGLGGFAIDDPRFAVLEHAGDEVRPGLSGWPQRIGRAWLRLREQNDLNRLHQALSRDASPPKVSTPKR